MAKGSTPTAGCVWVSRISQRRGAGVGKCIPGPCGGAEAHIHGDVPGGALQRLQEAGRAVRQVREAPVSHVKNSGLTPGPSTSWPLVLTCVFWKIAD